MRRLVAVLLVWWIAVAGPPGRAAAQDFDAETARRILRHGPWPPPWRADPSNRVSGQTAAASLGRLLFFDPRLSRDGDLACAGCHRPDAAWAEHLPRSQGHALVDRNANSLVDVRLQHWFGWDGAADSLWAQSLRPLLDPREMGGDAAHAAGVLRGDPELACRYRAAFDRVPPAEDQALLVDIGKALAAFQETLRGGRTVFDDLRDGLARGDTAAIARYPVSAARGLALFVGTAGCALCHAGPNFTNGEFHDIGVRFFVAPGRVDPGRFGGIQRLRASPFNRLGPHSDDATGVSATRTRHVVSQHRNWGEFRVPGLRNVARTAPYMHAGSMATLREVIKHYSELDEDRLHSDGEAILRPLRLSDSQIDDLLAFLETLTPREITAAPMPLERCAP